MDDFKENVIEFLHNERQATVTFTQGRYITRIKELSKRFPAECQITKENEDGSIVAHIPTRWVKINPPKIFSDEHLEVLRDRCKDMSARL